MRWAGCGKDLIRSLTIEGDNEHPPLGGLVHREHRCILLAGCRAWACWSCSAVAPAAPSTHDSRHLLSCPAADRRQGIAHIKVGIGIQNVMLGILSVSTLSLVWFGSISGSQAPGRTLIRSFLGLPGWLWVPFLSSTLVYRLSVNAAGRFALSLCGPSPFLFFLFLRRRRGPVSLVLLFSRFLLISFVCERSPESALPSR